MFVAEKQIKGQLQNAIVQHARQAQLLGIIDKERCGQCIALAVINPEQAFMIVRLAGRPVNDRLEGQLDPSFIERGYHLIGHFASFLAFLERKGNDAEGPE